MMPSRAREAAASGAPSRLASARVQMPPSPDRRVNPLGGESGWWYGAMLSGSSAEPASGGSPRLESRYLERALAVSWASKFERVDALSLPRVAPFLAGRHVVACCLQVGQQAEGVWGEVAGWERRVKNLRRQICCFGVCCK